MNQSRRISITFGVLLIAGIVFGLSSTVLALEEPDYIEKLSAIRIQVLLAVLSQCAMAVTYTCIAVVLYPILKGYDETAAIGYFSFRIVGAAFLYAGIVALLSLLFISESFTGAGQPESSYFRTIGELLRVGRDWINHIGMILPWSVGGLILYYSFFKMNVLPQWLSIWGLLSSCLTLIATLLFVVDAVKIVTIEYLVLNAPAVMHETTLSILLLLHRTTLKWTPR